MYGIKWNSNINGFTLVPLSEAEPIASLRPVFFEELDLLGFNEFWKYPKSKEPLLWFCTLNRTYYYKGNKVAKAKGGGFFQKPELEIYEKNLILEPINLESLVSENYKILQIFTNFALDFVGDVYEKHKNRICIVGFSGGKDSTVLLDLIQRVLSPIKFLVIFNDTSMELSSTYQFWEIIKSQYPNLKFITAKHEKDPLIAWDEFGIPSRIQRWCCTVYKMIPTLKILKQLFPEKTKILFFDGIRTDESPKRKSLEHISQGKYFNQLNVHPLLNWTLELIWLYIFHRNLPINSAYRYGISRIGCIVCPFESEWKETIIWLKYKDEAIPYLQKIIKYAEAKGIKDIENFVKEGNWKVRTDGKGWHKSKIIILEDKENIKLYTKNRKNFFEWLKIIKSTVRENYFTIFIDQKEYLIKYNLNDENLEIELNKKNNEEIFPLIKKLINKSAYCVKCRYCEIICPKNAITFNPEIKIKDNCSHCLRCLDIIVKGCLVAKSLDITITKEEMVNMYKLRDYCTFGMRKVWLEEFFRGAEKWLMGENSCGPVQFEAMKRWLVDAGFIKKETKGYSITKEANLLSQLGADDPFVWGIIWVNLAKNSSLISWYVDKLEWGKYYSREELLELMGERLSLATRKNALQSLCEIFKHTPLGKEISLGILVEDNKKVKGIKKTGLNEEKITSPLLAVFLYSLYKIKETKGKYMSLENLYQNLKENPFEIFGISKDLAKKILRTLQEIYGKEFISVDFAFDLDNVILNAEKKADDIIKVYIESKNRFK